MPRIDIGSLPWKGGSGYPAPFDAIVEGRTRKRLGDARLAPGAASSQRHWHDNEDEFVFVLSGEVVLVEEGGETVLRAGDAAAFKAGVANGHHLVNRSGAEARYLEIGTRAGEERAHYPDIDLAYARDGAGARFTTKAEAGQK